MRAHTQGGLQPNISQSNLKIFSVELQLDEETKTINKNRRLKQTADNYFFEIYITR